MKKEKFNITGMTCAACQANITKKVGKLEGVVLINTKKKPADFQQFPKLAGLKVATVDASAIAVRNRLGSAMSPIVNTAILGAFCKITGICAIDAVCASIKKGVPVKAEANAKAAKEAFDEVKFPVEEEAAPEADTAEEGQSA